MLSNFAYSALSIFVMILASILIYIDLGLRGQNASI